MMVSMMMSQSQEVIWDVIRHITKLPKDSTGSLYGEMSPITLTCEVSQTTNDAKFVKEAAPLHPIPVKPEVWRQVQHYCGHALTTVH